MSNKFTIKTSFHPYRMVLNRKEKVELTIEITNTSKEDKLISLTIQSPVGLSLNETLNINSLEKKIGTIKPNQIARLHFNLYSRFDIKEGDKEIQIKLREHYNSYNFISDEFNSKVILKVN